MPEHEIPQAGGGSSIEGTTMETVFDCLSDGILIIRADRTIAYANPAFAQLWRVPQELTNLRNDFALINHVLTQLAEPTAFIHEVERLYCSSQTSQDELAFKDGRLFSRRSVPMDQPGTQPARVWIFTDITHSRSDGLSPRISGLRAEFPLQKKTTLFGGIFKN